MQSLQILLKNPEKAVLETYTPVINKDKFRYIYESEQQPSYHKDINCERLTATFKNFRIPSEIEEKVKEKAEKEDKTEEETELMIKQEIIEFRSWFKSNFQLFQDNRKKFLEKLIERWEIEKPINEVERANSGVEYIQNLDVKELEQEIDKILREAGRFFTSNKDKQDILRRFQKLTFLAYNSEEIYNRASLKTAYF